MAAGVVDVKRYQIISLLYIIFVCFSVLNIKISSLDSNIYTIKTFQTIQVEELKKLRISNLVIANNIDTLLSLPKSKSYIKIATQLSVSLKVVDGVIDHVNNQMEKNGTNLTRQFNSRGFIEKTLKDPKGVILMEQNLFTLSYFIKNSPYKLSSRLDELIPLNKEVTTLKGRKDEWKSYLFFHKPMGISYMQLERIKLLIIQTQLIYQEAALGVIGYQATYYSKLNPKLYNLTTPVKDTISKIVRKVDSIAKLDSMEYQDKIFNKIIHSLSTENVFVGLSNSILHDFNYVLDKDFELDVNPKSKIFNSDKEVKIIFNKTGEYNLRFYDIRKGRKLLFEKKINVNKIPDPVVSVDGDNLHNYTISISDLMSAVRLEAKLDINNLRYFPGRINSYKVIKIHNGKEEDYYINYGEIFQSPTQKILVSLKKNDLLIFDNVSISLVDGTTRISSPIIYKITD
jgi:hypothetical protein